MLLLPDAGEIPSGCLAVDAIHALPAIEVFGNVAANGGVFFLALPLNAYGAGKAVPYGHSWFYRPKFLDFFTLAPGIGFKGQRY